MIPLNNLNPFKGNGLRVFFGRLFCKCNPGTTDQIRQTKSRSARVFIYSARKVCLFG